MSILPFGSSERPATRLIPTAHPLASRLSGRDTNLAWPDLSDKGYGVKHFGHCRLAPTPDHNTRLPNQTREQSNN